MDNRVLFIIMNNQVQYSQNTNVDHKELYNSLGGNPDNYFNTIRGFIYKDKIIFFKANLSYDKEVIDTACKFAPLIKSQMNNPYLKVCCGINPGQNGSSWEPIMTLNDSELITSQTINNNDDIKQKEEELKRKIEAPNETVIDFKNNYNDPKFIKLATIFTLIMIAITIVSKIILVVMQKIDFGNGWELLLSISQVILLVVTLVGYRKKMPSTKYIGIAASLALVFMFSLLDIILGVINLLFTIDQGYILKMLSAGKEGVSKIQKK